MRHFRPRTCRVPVLLFLLTLSCTPGVKAATVSQDPGTAPQQEGQEPTESNEPSDPGTKDPEAEAQEKAQEKAARDEKKQEAKQSDREAAEQAQVKRDQDVKEIEAAANDPWLNKWARFRSSTRDISTWDFKEGLFRMRFGFRFQGDGTAGSASTDLEALAGEIENSFKTRRLRLFADGDFMRRYHFRFEQDFAADAGLKDAYIDNIGRYKLKAVAFRIGNFKEPFSLERHSSSNDNAFQEWALPVQTFAPGRNLGIAGYGNHLKGRIGWSVGAFTNSKTTDDNRAASSLTLTGRVTGLPRYEGEGKSLVHVGLSLSARAPTGNDITYATRPEARFAPFFISTEGLSANTVYLAGLEVAAVQGPFWIQAEFLAAMPDVEEIGTLTFGGGYAAAGWFLTGESRPYRKRDSSFGRLEPIRPFRAGGNPFKKKSDGGALELAARVSTIDLSDGPVQGGRMLNLSLGINWYLTRANRLTANYIRSRVEDEGYANIVLIRYQFNPGYHWPPLDPRWRQKNEEEIGDVD
ncbi:MAG: porin [Acidobacteria bacterium]|nr:porin [Acidobacteriota bacterium]